MDRVKLLPVTFNQGEAERFVSQNLPFDLPVMANHTCDSDDQYDSSFMNIDSKWGLFVMCSLPSGYDGSWTEIGNADQSYA